MVMLAFYKAKGTWVDRLIRRWTRGAFSHVELIIDDGLSTLMNNSKMPAGLIHCISASSRDGGVRCKDITFKAENWQLLECPWVLIDATNEARKHLGKKYDYIGLILSQALNLRRHDKSTWFCSELVGAVIGLKEPHRLSPADLYLRCKEMNEAYQHGCLVGKLENISGE